MAQPCALRVGEARQPHGPAAQKLRVPHDRRDVSDLRAIRPWVIWWVGRVLVHCLRTDADCAPRERMSYAAVLSVLHARAGPGAGRQRSRGPDVNAVAGGSHPCSGW